MNRTEALLQFHDLDHRAALRWIACHRPAAYRSVVKHLMGDGPYAWAKALVSHADANAVVPAIKLVREWLHLGLYEAKMIVDSLRGSPPPSFPPDLRPHLYGIQSEIGTHRLVFG